MADDNSPPTRGIAWIASYPKSGNTWVRVFLYHLVRLQEGYPRADNDLHALDRASAYEARFYGLFQEVMGKPLAVASTEEVAAARPQVHALIAERSPNVALVKTHNIYGRVNGHATINVKVSAGSIYIVRDPRDVVLSLADHLGSSIDDAITVMETSSYATKNSAEVAFEAWGGWSQHVLSWTKVPIKSMMIVRYEDLQHDPRRVFTAVARHLHQFPPEEQLNEAVALSSFKELYEQESRGDFRERSEHAERFFRVGKSGQWHEQLSESQAQRIVTVHGEQMNRFGYLN